MDELTAPQQNRLLAGLSNLLRRVEQDSGPEFLPRGLDVMGLVRQLALPSAETVEKMSYGDPLFRMPTQSNIPITTDRGYLAEVLGMLPAVPAASRATTRLSNEAADALVRQITGRSDATAMRALEEIGQMSPVPQITTYHGSPYLFGKFDPGQKGMGEGAQEFGFGAGYTAESRPIAEYYKNELSQIEDLYDGKRFNREDAGHRAARLVEEKGGNLEQAIKETKEAIDYDTRNLAIKIESDHPLTDQAKKFLDEKIEMLGRLESKQIPTHSTRSLGYLYEGEIPDEIVPRFIDLDKKLSQQSPEVLRAVENIWEDLDITPIWKKDKDGKMYRANLKDLDGREIYSELQHYLSNKGYENADEYASQALEEYGLKGIRYLDATSRKSGEGTSNFIPFSPEDYRIQKINDRPIEELISQGLL